MIQNNYIPHPYKMDDEENQETSKEEKQEAMSQGMVKKMEKLFLKKGIVSTSSTLLILKISFLLMLMKVSNTIKFNFCLG